MTEEQKPSIMMLKTSTWSQCKSGTCHLSGEILEDGGTVDGGSGTNSSRGRGAGLQVSMDPEHDEGGEESDGHVDD